MRSANILYLFLTLTLLISGCSRQHEKQAQGYIEGRYTYVATSVSGVLADIKVQRGTYVKKDQPLFVLEEQPESDSYDAAIDNMKQALDARDSVAANLNYAKLTFERYKILVPKRAVPQSSLDNAQSIYNSTLADLARANASVATAKANLAEAKWTLGQKTINAPVAAIVFDTYYRLGEYTLANQPVLSLLAPGDIKAIFYVGEPDLSVIKLGEMVSVQCDSCEKAYQARVSFIAPSAEYTPPVIYSNETTVKLIYRIEAEFAPQDAYQLHPGQPVLVNYRR